MVSNAETEIHRDDKHPFTCEDESSPVNTRPTTCSYVAFTCQDESSQVNIQTPTRVPRFGVCAFRGSCAKAETTKEREPFYPMHNRHVICIPKVSNKITKQYIFGIFCALKIGYIEKLTEVPIKTDPTHKRIFVKVKWNQSELAKYIYNRFENGENVKVVYSEPWYWICVSNMASTTTARTYHGHE
jgi:hypothetical protein